MRIWDIEPEYLCRYHLLGEHRELHALWNIITLDKSGYRNHPETKRWRGRLAALYKRHQKLVDEMFRRGYMHSSPLDAKLATGKERQTIFLNTIEEQRRMLVSKKCPCLLK
jgi:hypothetical protein